jgi:hypothetical protein
VDVERNCEFCHYARLKDVSSHRGSQDLYNFQMTLQEIDGMRIDGKFVDSEGKKPEGQLVSIFLTITTHHQLQLNTAQILLYLLRRCYGLCYRLMSSSEPIAEELVPIANKLETIKRCLTEVARYGGVSDFREMYPYQLALCQIDALRVDGKFLGKDGSVPEGQAILNANLSECHEIMGMLREEMERNEKEGEGEEGEGEEGEE